MRPYGKPTVDNREAKARVTAIAILGYDRPSRRSFLGRISRTGGGVDAVHGKIGNRFKEQVFVVRQRGYPQKMESVKILFFWVM